MTADRNVRLLITLGGFFICNALIAEFIGVKIFSLEDTLGVAPFNWRLFGQSGTLSFTAGVLIWPIVFIMTDIINEYFGPRGVRFLSWLTVGLIAYAFLFAYIAIGLAPAGWWVGIAADHGIPDLQVAYGYVFGQGMWTIVGSIVAFLIGQLIDVTIFHRIRRHTGERMIWLRATGSTAVSQFVDSFVVLYIAFVLGPQLWPIPQFLAVGSVNYTYKLTAAVALIPLIYLGRRMIDDYLGAELAARMKAQAAYDTEVAERVSGPKLARIRTWVNGTRQQRPADAPPKTSE
ncbi:MAG: queuosine precursor transporter [Gammaproteobacteria bacterium]|nr:queuosine precursor transporter [Gammaproteobacteria bacterium]